MKKKTFLMLGMTVLALGGLVGCSKSSNDSAQNSSNDKKITVVTTTNVYSDIAKNIVGKYGVSKAIISDSSIDPHDFDPKTSDAKIVGSADIVVANGLGYDSWMSKLAKSVNKKEVLVGNDLMNLKNGDNPHIWYSLSMPKKYVNYLVSKFSKLQPTHKSYFKTNAEKYLKKVDNIRKIADKAANTSTKPVFVSEPVFDYALEQANIKIGNKDFEEAVERETDPSPKIVNTMINDIKARKIAFFVNNVQESSSTINTFVKLAKENNIPVLDVRETIPNNTTYLKWMQNNYTNLVDVSKK